LIMNKKIKTGDDMHQQKVETKKLRSQAALLGGISGAGAGAAASFFTAPLDIIRVRMQADPIHSSRYKDTLWSLKLIFAEEGIRGFYKGLSPNLYALIPNWAIYFSSYNFFKHHYNIELNVQDGPVLHLISAMTAAVITDVITNPIWLVKTRLQTQIFHPNYIKYNSTFDAFRKIIKEEGVAVLWSGTAAQLIGVTHVAVQFPVYEATKKYFMTKNNKTNNQLSALEIITCSSISKIIASTVAYPHEVLRSRMQSQRLQQRHYMNTWDAIKKIAREEGIRAFYRGIETNILRTVPAAAITFTTYEFIQRWLNNYFD